MFRTVGPLASNCLDLKQGGKGEPGVHLDYSYIALCVLSGASYSQENLMQGARYVSSSVALTVSVVALLGLMQVEGGLFDSCRGFSFVGVDVNQCRATMDQWAAGNKSPMLALV